MMRTAVWFAAFPPRRVSACVVITSAIWAIASRASQRVSDFRSRRAVILMQLPGVALAAGCPVTPTRRHPRPPLLGALDAPRPRAYALEVRVNTWTEGVGHGLEARRDIFRELQL